MARFRAAREPRGGLFATPGTPRGDASGTAGDAPGGEPLPGPGSGGPAAREPAPGVLVVRAAKAWFVVAGYALYFGLTRLLGPQDFGLYSVVTSIVSVLNNVLIAASLWSVSRFTARDPDRAGSVLSAGLKVQAVIGLGLFVLLAAASSAIGGFLRDPRLVQPLRIVALVVPAYALYAVNVGFFNGLRRFTVQAGLDILYSTLRVSLTLGAVILGLGVVGAVSGFVTAAIAILAISLWLVRREARPRGPFATRELLHFGASLLLLTLAANLTLNVDLWAVKRLSEPSQANAAAGIYRAALTVSQLLYQLLIPLALVLFPSHSHLGHQPDRERARGMVRGALRYLAVAVIPGAGLIAVMGSELLGLLYGRAYADGGALLVYLGPAYALYTCAYLLATALAGAGHPRTGVAVLATGLAVQVAGCLLLFPRFGAAGVAMGSLAGMGTGLVAGLAMATHRFGGGGPWASVARGLLLGAVLVLLARAWPAAGLMVAVKGLALGLAGVAALAAAGEIPLARLLRARRPAAG